MSISIVREILGTPVYHGIIQGLEALALHAENQTVSAAQCLPIEDVRFQAGIGVGIRQAISALTQKQGAP